MPIHPWLNISIRRTQCPPSSQVQPASISPSWLVSKRLRDFLEDRSKVSDAMTTLAGYRGRSRSAARKNGTRRTSAVGYGRDARRAKTGLPVVRHNPDPWLRVRRTLALARKWALIGDTTSPLPCTGQSGSSSRLRPWPLTLGATPNRLRRAGIWVFLMFPSESP